MKIHQDSLEFILSIDIGICAVRYPGSGRDRLPGFIDDFHAVSDRVLGVRLLKYLSATRFRFDFASRGVRTLYTFSAQLGVRQQLSDLDALGPCEIASLEAARCGSHVAHRELKCSGTNLSTGT
jgi:hypothetical protein